LRDGVPGPDDSNKDCLKEVTFHASTVILESAEWLRNVGRPTQDWTKQLLFSRLRGVTSLILLSKVGRGFRQNCKMNAVFHNRDCQCVALAHSFDLTRLYLTGLD